ncbi:MAG: hypothetical protein CVV12_02845 [Gammaproteobacteria bacterium HGW-Gammaproteobacteria-2]|jgi:hypothetical protein|nr:MAG: hypothetical protein CVV12_02845 [Gammaproteobacteria bacterium HGW-Gammaproteobacteria-2]
MPRPFSPVVLALVITLLSSAGLVHAAPTVTPQILAQESTALPAPASTGNVPITLNAGGRSFAFTLRNNPALAGRVPAGVRVLMGESAEDSSWARLSYFDKGWHGVLFDGISLWLIEPASPTTAATQSRTGVFDNVILYRAEDLQLPGFLFEANSHRAPLAPGGLPAQALLSELPKIAMAGVTRRLPVTMVADTAFRSQNGANSEVTLLTMFNTVDGIYSNQVGIGLELQHIELLADDGPLTATDLNNLLNQFGDFMFSGAGASIPRAGNAHLFTGRTASGGGVAWVGALCNARFGYGVNKFSFNINVSSLIFAHELGHNFGAPHDGESGSACESAAPGLMAPSVGSTDQFSQCSIQQMQPQIATAVCMIAIAVPGIVAADFTGNWFNRQRDGEGIQISLEGDGATFVLSYYTYLSGRQVWMIGSARPAASGETSALTFDLFITSGADFGSRFNPANVSRRAWGTVKVTVDGSDCNKAQMVVTPALPEFGTAFTVPIERIAVRSSCN